MEVQAIARSDETVRRSGELEDDYTPTNTQHATHLAQSQREVAEVAHGEGGDDPIKGGVREGQRVRGCEERGKATFDVDLGAADDRIQHRARQIDADDARGGIGRREKSEGEVAGTDTDVERDLVRAKTREPRGAIAPSGVSPEREQPVERVVAWCDPVEHRRDASVVLGAGHPASRYRDRIGTVLFVYAHPDDESFGIAGTAMKLSDAGHTTALLTLTRGDVGMWFGRERGTWSPAELAAERSKEWREAVGVIGFGHARLLEWPDGGLAASPAERVTADVVQMIREIRPDVVCTFGPEGAGSEHDDHRAASFFALRGFFRAAAADQYPDRGAPHEAGRLFFNASPLIPGVLSIAMTPTHVVDIAAYQDRKAKAFECHRTQFKDRDRFYQILEARGGKEHFHLAIDRGARSLIAGDLFS